MSGRRKVIDVKRERRLAMSGKRGSNHAGEEGRAMSRKLSNTSDRALNAPSEFLRTCGERPNLEALTRERAGTHT
jgi:hypothetical protein